MTSNDITLLLLAAAAIIAVIVLIAQCKLHPFLALIICGLGVSLAAGAGMEKALKSFATGFGDITANVGVVLALGAMFGSLLAAARGAERLARALMERGGTKSVPWAMAGLGMLIGLPVFFETGVVMIMPIIIAVGAQMKNRGGHGAPVSGVLLAGLPALAGLSVMHALMPPHPGPLVAVHALNADLGLTMVLGFAVAVPVLLLAGPLFALWAARHASAQPPAGLMSAPPLDAGTREPSITMTLLTLLFPILLMLAKAAADISMTPGLARQLLDFAGTPVVALLLANLLALCTFGYALGHGREKLSAVMAGALPPIAAILFVIGAGGAFKQALVDIGVGAAMAHGAGTLHLPPLLLGWGTAVLIRIATGSATVATVTAAGLMAGLGGPGIAALMALAIGSGSVFFSNVNDAGFWLIKGYFGMSLKDVFKTWSLLETIISVAGLVLVLLISWT